MNKGAGEPVSHQCGVPSWRPKADGAALIVIWPLGGKEVIVLFTLCGHTVGPGVHVTDLSKGHP